MSFEHSGEMPDVSRATIGQEVQEAIPESCKDCAVQCELGAYLVQKLFVKHLLIHSAESLIGDSGQAFDALIDASASSEVAEEFKRFARENTAHGLDMIDQEIDKAKAEMVAASADCHGPVKMRATKNGVEYTVGGICTSPDRYPDPDENHVSVHITTRKVK